MRHYKRILAAIGSAALLISNLGGVTQTVFAGEQTATETAQIDPGGAETTGSEDAQTQQQDQTDLQTSLLTESDPDPDHAVASDATDDAAATSDGTAADSGGGGADSDTEADHSAGNADSGTATDHSTGSSDGGTTADHSAGNADSGTATDHSTGSSGGGTTEDHTADSTNSSTAADTAAGGADSSKTDQSMAADDGSTGTPTEDTGTSASTEITSNDTTAQSENSGSNTTTNSENTQTENTEYKNQTGTDAGTAGENTGDTAGQIKEGAAGQAGTEEQSSGEQVEDEEDISQQEISKDPITYENTDADGLTVTAVTEKDAIPEGYNLKVTEITDEEQLSEIKEQLLASDSVGEFDGFIAYDVGFVNDNDEEIEPEKGSLVDVTFEFDENTLPAGIDANTLEIQHIDESGEETKVVTVADREQKSDGDVKVASTEDQDTVPAVTAEFSLGSFSIIVWTYLGDIDLTSISGSTTVTVGKSIELRCTTCQYGYSNRTWSCSDTSIATLSNTTNSRVSLKGVKRGTVTITHTHTSRNGTVTTDSIDVTVLGANDEKAQVYAQATPSSDAGSNDSSEWTSLIGEAIICVDDARWDSSGKNTTGKTSGEDATSFMVSWPDGSTGKTWELTNDLDYNDGDYFDKVWGMIETAYERALSSKLGISTLNKDNVKKIVLTPYKVSQGNGTNPDKHVDCTISVTLERQFTVQFNVKEVGETTYKTVHTDQNAYKMTLKNYVGSAESVKEYIYECTNKDGNTTQYQMGATRVDPDTGVTYKLTGWYTENGQGGARSNDLAVFNNGYYKPKTETTIDSSKNTVTKLPELTDYVLNLYAEWEVVTGDLEVGKTVNATDGFYTAGDTYDIQVTLYGVNKDANGDYIASPGKSTVVDLSIKDGGTAEVKGIPSGTHYSVAEKAASGEDKGFKVTYAYYDSDGNPVTNATNQIIEPDETVKATVTNSRKVVLTGVGTTDTPMAAMLATIAMAIIGTAAYRKARQHIQ